MTSFVHRMKPFIIISYLFKLIYTACFLIHLWIYGFVRSLHMFWNTFNVNKIKLVLSYTISEINCKQHLARTSKLDGFESHGTWPKSPLSILIQNAYEKKFGKLLTKSMPRMLIRRKSISTLKPSQCQDADITHLSFSTVSRDFSILRNFEFFSFTWFDWE